MHITPESIDETRQRLKALPGKDNVQSAIKKLRPDIEAKLADGLTYKDIGPEVHAGLGLEAYGIKAENVWRVIAAALKRPKDTPAKDRQARPELRRKAGKPAPEPGGEQMSLFKEADPGSTLE